VSVEVKETSTANGALARWFERLHIEKKIEREGCGPNGGETIISEGVCLTSLCQEVGCNGSKSGYFAEEYWERTRMGGKPERNKAPPSAPPLVVVRRGQRVGCPLNPRDQEEKTRSPRDEKETRENRETRREKDAGKGGEKLLLNKTRTPLRHRIHYSGKGIPYHGNEVLLAGLKKPTLLEDSRQSP